MFQRFLHPSLGPEGIGRAYKSSHKRKALLWSPSARSIHTFYSHWHRPPFLLPPSLGTHPSWNTRKKKHPTPSCLQTLQEREEIIHLQLNWGFHYTELHNLIAELRYICASEFEDILLIKMEHTPRGMLQFLCNDREIAPQWESGKGQ